MSKQKSTEFGLQLTNNSKTGAAFSLSRSSSCIHKTATCWQVCYGRGIRYQSTTQKEKRERNFRTQFLLHAGGPELLAENLALLVDQARPVDWVTARITGEPTNVPWSVRIHDVGDFYSIEYTQAWIQTVQARPQCRFWFYTRSFVDDALFPHLTELAEQPNCRGWISVDADNYNAGILSYCRTRHGIWNIALLQEDEMSIPPDMMPSLLSAARPGEIVAFPKHHGGRHVQPIKADNLTVCPQVLGAYPLQPNPQFVRPCQLCSFCLPAHQ